MKILTTSASSQTIKVIPRSYDTTGTLEVTDESTNKTYTYSSSSWSVDKNYLQIPNAYTDSGSSILKEGRFYNIVVKNGSSAIIYRDKIFVTDQTISNGDFTINSGEYVTSGAAAMNDDEYVII